MNTQYIHDLLLDNDYVTIPGLGGFVCEYQPAVLDKLKSTVLPPSRRIAFNRALNQNDGLLVQYIVVRDSITYKEAEEKVRAFASQCNMQLRQMGSLQIPKIGRLYVDDADNIRFTPSHEPLPLDDSFGLPNVDLIPVIRRGEELDEEIVEVEKVTTIVTKKQRGWLYWAAASIAGIFLMSTVWMNIGQPPIQNVVTADFFSSNKVITSLEQNVLPNKGNEEIKTQTFKPQDLSHLSHINLPASKIDNTQEEEVVEGEILDAQNSSKVYSIVVGAFKGPITASRFKDNLIKKGYDAVLIEPTISSRLIKVVINYEALSEEEALVDIRTSVDEYAWLLN